MSTTKFPISEQRAMVLGREVAREDMGAGRPAATDAEILERVDRAAEFDGPGEFALLNGWAEEAAIRAYRDTRAGRISEAA